MAEGDKVLLAPLRSLDEFVLGQARFQIPEGGLEKWSNRVYQNLLYYQSNYFLTYLVVFLCVSLLHPSKMLCGTVAVTTAGVVASVMGSNREGALEFKRKHPLVFVGMMLVLTYFMVYFLIGSVAVFLLGLLLPLTVIFLHATLRLRNLRNKVFNKIELAGLQRSLMGLILETLGVEHESSM